MESPDSSSRLARPSPYYQSSFLEAVKEYQEEFRQTGNLRLERYVKLDIDWLTHHFREYVDSLVRQADGKGLPEGYVPNSVFWLIDNNEFIGWVDIRHQLTPKLLKTGGHIGYDIRPSRRNRGYGKRILRLALDEAVQLGIEKVLVTCDITNLASKRIIEANGGTLENSVKSEDGKPKKLRFWVTRAPNSSKVV